MKTLLTLFISLGLTMAAMAQSDELETLVDMMPALKSCDNLELDAERQRCTQLSLMEFLRNHIVLTQEEKLAGLNGLVMVSFTVTKEGRATDPTIEKSLSPGVDKSVMDAVGKFPEFAPGMKDGKAVNVRLKIPMRIDPQ
jgi:TonB family protein